MKLLRYGQPGYEKPGLCDAAGRIRDLSDHVADISGSALESGQIQKLSGLEIESLPLVDGNPRLGACVGGVGKIICIGLNYSDHAAEVGKEAPPEPVIFQKATTSICGPEDPIEIPRGSQQTDWEVELGVVIGMRAKYVAESDAMNHVAGYCTVNDVSERQYQSERQGQWTKGKSHDTFAPLGPWMVTADEVADPLDLRLWCEVDGVMRQDGSTSTMIFDIKYLISYLSQFMTLEPGDVIATGTPPGVGKGIKPESVFLQPGQRLRCGVEGLGEQDHLMIQA